MSPPKIVLLLIYLALGLCALLQGGTPLGVWSLRILLLLAVVHAIEVVVFYKLAREAGGSLALHVLNIFLFGILHANELKDAKGA
ncbi:MAG: hypothetical protein Hals2KO_03700 [Halioglobus sp.]